MVRQQIRRNKTTVIREDSVVTFSLQPYNFLEVNIMNMEEKVSPTFSDRTSSFKISVLENSLKSCDYEGKIPRTLKCSQNCLVFVYYMVLIFFITYLQIMGCNLTCKVPVPPTSTLKDQKIKNLIVKSKRLMHLSDNRYKSGKLF